MTQQPTARQKAAFIRIAAHNEIYSLCESACSDKEKQLHVLAKTGERQTRPKCKLIIAIPDTEQARNLCDNINTVVQRTQAELKTLNISDKFEYNIKLAQAQSSDILLSTGEAYKQTKHTGEELLSRCLNVFDQIIIQHPERAAALKEERAKFSKLYKEELSQIIQSTGTYYLIQSTGNNYRLTYYGTDEKSTEPHRVQASVGDICIMSGINELAIRNSMQKTRSDKTSAEEYIYIGAYFKIKPL